MPGKFSTWLLTILFLIFLGLTAWIVWAVNKIERHPKPAQHTTSGRAFLFIAALSKEEARKGPVV